MGWRVYTEDQDLPLDKIVPYPLKNLQHLRSAILGVHGLTLGQKRFLLRNLRKEKTILLPIPWPDCFPFSNLQRAPPRRRALPLILRCPNHHPLQAALPPTPCKSCSASAPFCKNMMQVSRPRAQRQLLPHKELSQHKRRKVLLLNLEGLQVVVRSHWAIAS